MNSPIISKRSWLFATKLPLVTLMFSISFIISGCSESDARDTDVKSYVHQASSALLQHQSQYQVTRKFVGKVQTKQNANLGFEQLGKIAAVLVDEGQLVKQGDMLAQQDIQLLKIERQELQAQLNHNNADLALVKTNLNRIKALNKKAYSSAQTLDELLTRQQVLLSLKQQIGAKLNANQLRINKSSLFAPFNAVVSKRFISVGEVVAPGTATLQLLQTDQSEIKVGVPVKLLDNIAISQQFNVTIAGQEHQVELVAKGLDVDPLTRTVQLRFKLIDSSALINGQLAYLHLPQAYAVTGYWVPITALTDGVRGLWNIYTLQPEQQTDLFKLHSRNVEVLYLTQDQAYIRAVFDNNQRYLTAGLHRLVPGQLVSINSSTTNNIAVAGRF